MAKANPTSQRGETQVRRGGSAAGRTEVRSAAAAIKVRRLTAAPSSAAEPALPGALCAGVIELSTEAAYRVRLWSGELVTASAAPGLDPRLADECLRDRRTVLVTSGPSGAVILGALQTSPTLLPSGPTKRARITAKEIELAAEDRISLRVGKSALVIDHEGGVRLLGDRMTLRMAKVLKVLAANVELP